MGQSQSTQEELIMQRKKQREQDIEDLENGDDPFGYQIRIDEEKRDRQFEEFEQQLYPLQVQAEVMRNESKQMINNLKNLQFRSEIYQQAVVIDDYVEMKYDKMDAEDKQRQIEAEKLNQASLANQALQQSRNQQTEIQIDN